MQRGPRGSRWCVWVLRTNFRSYDLILLLILKGLDFDRQRDGLKF
jgi:hypothetical protein